MQKFLPVFRRKRLSPLCQLDLWYSYATLNEIPRTFDAPAIEEAVKARWKSRKPPDNRLNDKSYLDDNLFRIILPPPNVTGKLHLGHALTVAIQDSIVRWKYMTGSSVKWIPGFDHAGIATQSVVWRKLEKQNASEKGKSQPIFNSKNKDELQTHLKEFAELSSANISQQLERLGALLHWPSTYYTLDKNHSNVVTEAFIQLFEDELIHRSDGIVNWSSALQTSISDVECIPVPFNGKISLKLPGLAKNVDFGQLFFVKYQLEDSREFVTVATSRPETIFADVALAVNPNDEKLSSFVGQRVVNPLNHERIPIIADPRVKPSFGSGVLKVTPAHDKIDFQIGIDHKLANRNIFTVDGKLNDLCGHLQGQHRFIGRSAVIKMLSQSGALTELKDYQGSLDVCSRTGDAIECRILPHWFFKTTYFSKKITDLITSNEISINPDYQKGILLHTLSKSQDWCLSRQIQWGHPIPVYFHPNHPTVWIAAFNKTEAAKKLSQKLGVRSVNEDEIEQDPDVLDTWFSSALIPLAVSGWPDVDSESYREVTLMETGGDIIVFWVWRMIMLNLALVNRLPFRHVLLHGLITDGQGRKMSKSRGNVVDPIHLIEGRSFEELMNDAKNAFESGELDKNEYKIRLAEVKKNYPHGFPRCGTDAVRFVLLSQNIFKESIKLDKEHLASGSHFMNKLWQAMRFFFHHADKGVNHPTLTAKPEAKYVVTIQDRWILACLFEFTQEVEEAIPASEFFRAVTAIRKFFQSQFCDVYIELIKSDLMNNAKGSEFYILVMRYVFNVGLRLMHPFIPFVSEEMWMHLTQDTQGLLLDISYPKSSELSEFQDPHLLILMSKVLKIVTEIRALRLKSGLKSKNDKGICYIELVGTRCQEILTLRPIIDTLTNCQVEFECPPRSSRASLSTSSVIMDDTESCRISIVNFQKTSEDESNQMNAQLDPIKILKIKAQLERLQEELKQGMNENSKERILRKIQSLTNQLAAIENTSSKKLS